MRWSVRRFLRRPKRGEVQGGIPLVDGGLFPIWLRRNSWVDWEERRQATWRPFSGTNRVLAQWTKSNQISCTGFSHQCRGEKATQEGCSGVFITQVTRVCLASANIRAEFSNSESHLGVNHGDHGAVSSQPTLPQAFGGTWRPLYCSFQSTWVEIPTPGMLLKLTVASLQTDSTQVSSTV